MAFGPPSVGKNRAGKVQTQFRSPYHPSLDPPVLFIRVAQESSGIRMESRSLPHKCLLSPIPPRGRRFCSQWNGQHHTVLRNTLTTFLKYCSDTQPLCLAQSTPAHTWAQPGKWMGLENNPDTKGQMCVVSHLRFLAPNLQARVSNLE